METETILFFNPTRVAYLEGLADDVFGVVGATIIGASLLAALYGGGRAVSAGGRAVGGRRNQVVVA